MASPARSGPLREAIENDLRRRSNVFVIARRYNTTAAIVEQIQEELGLTPPRLAGMSPVEYLMDYVPKGLRKTVLQMKPVCAKWRYDNRLLEARRAYDAGVVELCTGRIRTPTGDYLVLYCIPRTRPDKKRRRYFSVTYEG